MKIKIEMRYIYGMPGIDPDFIKKNLENEVDIQVANFVEYAAGRYKFLINREVHDDTSD